MAKPDSNPSVNREPHLRDTPLAPDPSVEKARQHLASEHARSRPGEDEAKHSVFDEPAILPHRTSVLIERDWSCRKCGYNLRGLMTKQRCPECGTIELYEPPRAGELTYLDWCAQQKRTGTAARDRLVRFLVPLSGAFFSIACAMLTVEYAMGINFMVIGPLTSEILKIAAVAALIERRSQIIRTETQLVWMAVGTAFVFAIVQNALYFMTYLQSATYELTAYRWTACVLLHVACTAIAVRGLLPVWRNMHEQNRTASLASAYPAVVAATALHAAINAYVYVAGDFGYGF